MTTLKPSLSFIWLDWWLLQSSRTPCRFQGSNNASKRALQCQKAATYAFWDQEMPFPQVWYSRNSKWRRLYSQKTYWKGRILSFLCSHTHQNVWKAHTTWACSRPCPCKCYQECILSMDCQALPSIYLHPSSSESTIAWRRFGGLNFGGISSSISISPPFFRIWNRVRQCARESSNCSVWAVLSAISSEPLKISTRANILLQILCISATGLRWFGGRRDCVGGSCRCFLAKFSSF